MSNAELVFSAPAVAEAFGGVTASPLGRGSFGETWLVEDGNGTKTADGWQIYKSRSAFALSAMTGSGKTVIATAVIEALLFGSADLGVDADARATFLWVTDDPALNRQTRNKMMAASDLLTGNQFAFFEAALHVRAWPR